MEINKTDHSELVEFTEFQVLNTDPDFGMTATVRGGRLLINQEDANGKVVADIDVTMVEYFAQLLVAIAADGDDEEEPPAEEPPTE